MQREILFSRVAIIGYGLMGSSLGRALRDRGLVGHICACDRDEGVLARVASLGICDSTERDMAAAVTGADLVVLAVPVGASGQVAEAVAPALGPGAIVTDLGSVKEAVIREVTPHLPRHVAFVPGHPVAGTEKSGPEHGFAELFSGRYVILTPEPSTVAAPSAAGTASMADTPSTSARPTVRGPYAEAVARVTEMWERCGARVEIMDPAHHDRAMAIVSHLPHLIAYTIVATATDLEDDRQKEVVRYSAGGFRDFTRIAASDPIMWRDIFLANREAVLEMLQRFGEDLTALQRAIRWGDGETLERLFTRTRTLRRDIIEARQAGTFRPTEEDIDTRR